MAQFTPPNFPNPMVMSLLQDQQRQAQWERTQNARIQQEQRAAKLRAATEDAKWRRDVGLRAITEAGADPSTIVGPNNEINLDAALQALSSQGESVDRRMTPLAGPLAPMVGAMSNLQKKADLGGTITPENEALIRSASQAASGLTPRGPGGRRLGQLAMGVADERAEMIAEESREESRTIRTERRAARRKSNAKFTENLSEHLLGGMLDERGKPTRPLDPTAVEAVGQSLIERFADDPAQGVIAAADIQAELQAKISKFRQLSGEERWREEQVLAFMEEGATRGQAVRAATGKAFKDPATGAWIAGSPTGEHYNRRFLLKPLKAQMLDVIDAANEVASVGAGYPGASTIQALKAQAGATDSEVSAATATFEGAVANFKTMLVKFRSGAAFSETELKMIDAVLPLLSELQFSGGELGAGATAKLDVAMRALNTEIGAAFEDGENPLRGKPATGEDRIYGRAVQHYLDGKIDAATLEKARARWLKRAGGPASESSSPAVRAAKKAAMGDFHDAGGGGP